MQDSVSERNQEMPERIKLTPQEAKDKTEAIRKVILDTYHREVQPLPFFNDLRAGTLSRPRLQGWIKNWYSFALEVNTGMATVYHQFVGFFKRHPELEDRIAQKIGEEFTTPAIGGHARMLPILGKALGVTPDEMIECELIPEARGLVDFFVRAWIDIPLAECFAVHMEEEIFGFISRDFQQSLPKYGVSKEDMKYFRVHEEADLAEEHGGTNQAILEVALQEGYGSERAGWPLEYCGKIAVQMIGNFYEGVYRRYP
jgi:pyrroloquinoline quinone (PQQ) biosynthesis protein C